MVLTLDNALDYQFNLTKFWNKREERIQFRVNEAVTIQLSNGDIITAPAGMITDFRSAPVPAIENTLWRKSKAYAGMKIVNAVVPQIGRHSPAVFVHDVIYIYLKHRYGREFADKEMCIWLKACGVEAWRREAMHAGVAIAGQKWWDN